MKKKLNCILLIDDDEDCNFIHKRMLKMSNCVEKIQEATNGFAALEFLKSVENGIHPHPSLILLDINMPKMNGWEFLEEYQKLQKLQKGKVVLVMLTSSLNPDDEKRAKAYSDVAGFNHKFLDKDSLDEILQKHFSDHF